MIENKNGACPACQKGLRQGLIYGFMPHLPCLLFIIFSILGTTFAITLIKPLLLWRYFFYFLIFLSFVFASLSAIFYLKRNKILFWQGIKKRWKYLSILYGMTIGVNLILFMIIFPLIANIGGSNNSISGENSLVLQVDIPCPGHAPLITNELKKLNGIGDIKFHFPNIFEINFNPKKISPEEILSLDIFKNFRSQIIK